MKKLFLVCNAHLDPIWLWEWEEGAAAAISTFRVAADFCEEYDGFVFCHNEALLYQWTEEYDMPLFKRIQALVAEGRWNIMGGWFLQPDCNMPSGETMIRQILAGREYFREKFQVEPEVALNFDSFGHDRGLVQILKQCGYKGYVFMRPEKQDMDLPERNFLWESADGSTILTHRLDMAYSSIMGEACNELKAWVESEKDEAISLFTWGVGNHGGGPSRQDYAQIEQWISEQKDIQVRHSTMEDFFRELEAEQEEFPQISHNLQPVNVGCYTSQSKIKLLHRRLENELYSVEKLVTNASAQGLMEYPKEELSQAQRDLLISEFHDVLPGTTIQPAYDAAIRMMYHGLDILAKLRMRGFMALMSGQEKAKEGTFPIFVYNPHPYPVETIVECEFMPASQNRSRTMRNKVTILHEGEVVPSQREKEFCNINMDWRKKMVFKTVLKPSAINRYDCEMHMEPIENNKQWECLSEPIDGEKFVFETKDMLVEINTTTGLVDRYCVDGDEYLQSGSFAPVVFKDNADPWYMETTGFVDKEDRFTLMSEEAGSAFSGVTGEIASVRVVEDGPVRTVVETVMSWNHSFLVQTYRLPKTGKEFEIEQRIYWNEKDRMLKLEIPTTIKNGTYMGQGMFGSNKLIEDGRECVSQKWCGLFDENKALTIANIGTYGSHLEDGTIYLSLLRSPAYAGHPVDLPILPTDRFTPRIDQGEHVLRFFVSAGDVSERKTKIDLEAQIHNEVPYALNVFPGGIGEKPQSFVVISNEHILLSAMYRSSVGDKLIIRLWNSCDTEEKTTIEFPAWNLQREIVLSPFRFQTYVVDEKQGVMLVDPMRMEIIDN